MTELVLVPTALEARAIFGVAPEGLELIELGPNRLLGLCGFGLAAAGACAGHHIARSGARQVLLVGIAGSHDPVRAPLAAVICGSRVRSHGIGLGQAEAFRSPAQLGFPESPLGLAELPLATRRDLPSMAIVSVAAASADADEAAALHRRHTDHLVEDMETWAVALAAQAHGLPLQVLRAISNIAGEHDKSLWRISDALTAIRLLLTRAEGSQAC